MRPKPKPWRSGTGWPKLRPTEKTRRGPSTHRCTLRPLLGALSFHLAMPAAQAWITRFEVLRTELAFAGEAFGTVGAYQHVAAHVQEELDPADPRNAVIQDLDLAPRDARGMVHYETGPAQPAAPSIL